MTKQKRDFWPLAGGVATLLTAYAFWSGVIYLFQKLF